MGRGRRPDVVILKYFVCCWEVGEAGKVGRYERWEVSEVGRW